MLLQRKPLAFVAAKIIKVLSNVFYYDERNCIGPV